MRKTNRVFKSLACRMPVMIGAAALIACMQPAANATQTVRELFDGLNAGHDYSTIDGLTKTDDSTLGLQGAWVNNPPGSTSIVYKDTFSLSWPLGNMEYNYGGEILSDTGNGGNGLLNYNTGGNVNTNIDPVTSGPYGNWSSQSYSIHPLLPSAFINFQSSSTNFFSVRIDKAYSWITGNASSAGLGFSTGIGSTAHFVGVGVTMPSPFLAPDGVTDIGDSSYISAGTLGQAGTGFNSDPAGNGNAIDGGPYYPNAHGIIGYWTNVVDGANQYAESALLLGRLVTTPSGASELDVKTYLPNGPVYTNVVNGVTNITLEPDINNITWEATYSFNETSVMTNLLVWMHGNTLEYDAIRVGTSYGDVVGLELIGPPSASPALTNFSGVTVTLSQNASLNDGAAPMTFQWYSNSVAIMGQTNSTLVLSNTTTSFTAGYNVSVNNFYGTLTSAVTQVTFLPAVPPTIVQQPTSITRYTGSPMATFSVVVNGTPQFTYQWMHAGTNIFLPVTTSSVTNILTLPPIASTDAGAYYVVITNGFGAITSVVANLSEIMPPVGSYTAELTSLVAPTNLYAYWRLDDNVTATNTALIDFWGNHNGWAVDLTYLVFDAPGANYAGFPPPHSALELNQPWNGSPLRAYLNKLPNYNTNMTFAMWVKGNCELMSKNGYGNSYGIEFNNNSLQFDWGGHDSLGHSTNVLWNSGISASFSDWAFVVLVVQPTNATFYVGANPYSLVSADSGALIDLQGGTETLSDSTSEGDTPYLYPLSFGRNPAPWAEDGNGSGWATTPGTWSDIAVINQALTAQQVTNLFLAGVGMPISGTPDGSGNLNLNWFPSFTLQQATSITGPWTDVSGSPVPPYSVPISTTTPQVYYRVRQ